MRFNGSIAAAFASLDVKQFHLDIDKASATQGSTTGLIKAIEEFNQAFAPMSADLLTLGNGIATGVVKIGTFLSGMYQRLKSMDAKLAVLSGILAWLESSDTREDRNPQARALMVEILSDRGGPARRQAARTPIGRVR